MARALKINRQPIGDPLFLVILSICSCVHYLNIKKSVDELSLWLLMMDPVSINVLVGIVSSVAMLAAIIFMLTYVLGSFSAKSAVMSPKVVVCSLVYFLGATILLFMGVEWLSDLARVPMDGIPFYLNIGASVLALNATLHVSCGLLTIFIYLKRRISER